MTNKDRKNEEAPILDANLLLFTFPLTTTRQANKRQNQISNP